MPDPVVFYHLQYALLYFMVNPVERGDGHGNPLTSSLTFL